jgi:glycosyltransferase involved in cell wall biosynthesis
MAEAVAQVDALCLRVPGPIGTCAWRLRAGRPFAVEVVGDPLEVLSARAVRTVARPLLRSLLARDLRAMCRGAEAASYVTEAVLQQSYPPGGWSTSYSSIDLGDDALASEEQVRSRVGGRPPDADGCWRLVFVGSLARLYKGPDVLIDAVALCRARGMRLALSVIGDGGCRVALEARARSRGVAGAVRFAGQLPAGAAVREALDAAHLFVLPSRGEGLPRAMIEAMARGIPCLGTAVSGIPELLPADRLVPPDDAGALARALGHLCSPGTDLVALGLRDLAVARRYGRAELQPRRQALLSRLRAASEAGRYATPAQGAA